MQTFVRKADRTKTSGDTVNLHRRRDLARCGAFLTVFLSAMLFGAVDGRAEQNVIVVVDDSGSMDDRMQTAEGRKRRIEVAKQALIGVLQDLPPNTRVGVLALNSQVNRSSWIVPFGTGDPGEWAERIDSLRASGGTPLGEFMKVAADELLSVRQKQLYGNYRLLIVTDGEANDQRLLDAYLPDVLSRGLTVDVIGVDMQGDHSLATRVHNYRRADDAKALEQALQEVFAETVSDGQDDETDFDLLAALPEGFAEQAIEALASQGNQPIGGVLAADSPESIRISGGSAAGEFFIGGSFCCLVGFGFIVIVAFLVVGAGRKR